MLGSFNASQGVWRQQCSSKMYDGSNALRKDKKQKVEQKKVKNTKRRKVKKRKVKKTKIQKYKETLFRPHVH